MRPGPIQSGMVHPYLRNREIPEDRLVYPSAKLEKILRRTRGVPLFHEQAMQIAIDCAGFLPGKADKLRRGMATFRRSGTIHRLKDDFINGMLGNKYDREFAERCFKQIEGFWRVTRRREPCRQLRHPGLRLVLGEMVSSRGLRRGAAQRSADGLLCAGGSG